MGRGENTTGKGLVRRLSDENSGQTAKPAFRLNPDLESLTMRIVAAIASVLALNSGLAFAHPRHTERAEIDTVNPKTIDNFQALAIQSLEEAELTRRNEEGGCTLANARVRRDW